MSKPVVLVVESHPLVRTCMVEALVEADFQALDAGSADEAIEILEARKDIGVVFTETKLSGATDGIELARRIRDRFPLVNLIVATARPVAETACLPAGTSVFPMPYHDEDVVQKVAELLITELSRAPDLMAAHLPIDALPKVGPLQDV